MKKLIALLMILTLVLCMVACGDDKSKNKKDGGGNNDDTESVTSGETSEPSKITGETYDAGEVNVLVPEGWKAFPVADMFSEEEGAVCPDQITIIKGGTSEFDMLSKPSIKVICYEPEGLIQPSKDWYDNAEEIEPIVAGDLTWNGFTTIENDGSSPMALLWTTNADGYQFQANMFLKPDQNEIKLTDADVLLILESVCNSK